MISETQEQKAARQIEIENTFRTRNIERSRKLMRDAIENGRAHELSPVARMIAAAYDTVAAAIDKLKAEKSAGQGAKYRAFFRMIPTDVLAVIGLTTCIDSLTLGDDSSASNTAQAVLASLGRQVQAEILAFQLDAAAPAYMNRVHEYIKERKTTSPSHILKTLRASAEQVNFNHTPWHNTQCIIVGRLLMECVWETGMFEWVAKQKGKNKMSFLEAAPAVHEKLFDIVQHAETINIRPPMIVPPNPHTNLFDGGYLTNIDRRGTYRNTHIGREELRAVNSAFKDAEQLRAALNKLQSVPYCINTTIFDLLQQARAQNVSVGMPSMNPLPKPEWHLDGVPKDTYDEHTQELFKEWKLKMRTWYADEKARMSQVRSLVFLSEVCKEFKDEDELYFPTCVDWRYRVYFKSGIHPQGSDLQKAILQFATARPLGKRGLHWLKVHVATCYGYDKTLFEDRAAWADANLEQLRAMVADPFNSEAFKGADSPWCFLAAAIDLVAALDSIHPEEYCSRIPVAMDATNSGGQHFSAILRDSVGGKLTNLFWTGNPEKADLYMDVKQRTDSMITLERGGDNAVQAEYWTENPITRAMTKRPTMTYFYSATVRSCSDYILKGALDEGYIGTEEYTLWKLSGYLAPKMRQAIEEANPAAAACMQYLQDIAKRVPRTHALTWKSPLGGLVINRYSETEESRVNVRSMNLYMLLAYNRNYEICNRRKATAGIAPNFIHSLDATHLCMTALEFTGDMVPIHDSMATHACDVDEMQLVIREQFVKLYTEHDVLGVVAEAAQATGADLTDIERPECGDLDINRVVSSPFFFC